MIITPIPNHATLPDIPSSAIADHTGFLDLGGTRAMTGTLDMGTNNISNAGALGVGTITATGRIKGASFVTTNGAVSNNGIMAIGSVSQATSAGAIALGQAAEANSGTSIVIGSAAVANNAVNGIAIGTAATVGALRAIQIGQGSNSVVDTIAFGISGTKYMSLAAGALTVNATIASGAITAPSLQPDNTGDFLSLHLDASGQGISGVKLFENAATGDRPILVIYGYADALSTQKLSTIGVDTSGRLVFSGSVTGTVFNTNLEIAREKTLNFGNTVTGFLHSNVASGQGQWHMTFGGSNDAFDEPVWVLTDESRKALNFGLDGSEGVQLWIHDGSATVGNVMKLKWNQIHLLNNGKILMGDGGNASIEYDSTDLVIDTDIVNTGSLIIGDKSGGNYLEVEPDGDLVFAGTAGFIYGHMNIPTANFITVDTSATNDPVEIKSDGTGGETVNDGWESSYENETTFAVSDLHYITVTIVGTYEVLFDISVRTAAGAGTVMHGGIMIDGVAQRDNGEGHTHIFNALDDIQMNGIGTVDCPNGNEEISLWVSNGQNQKTIIEHGNMRIKMIGGT